MQNLNLPNPENPFPNSPYTQQPYPKPPYTSPTTTSLPKSLATPQPNTCSSHLPIRRITSVQQAERRAQGLCFNCDEKFIPDHKCLASKFLLLMVEEDYPMQTQDTNETIDEVDVDSEPQESEEIYFQLSPQAVNGQFPPKTLKFKGLLDGLLVTILIDTGSTHNILQPRIGHHLKIPSTTYPIFLLWLEMTPNYIAWAYILKFLSHYKTIYFSFHFIYFQFRVLI